VSRVKGIRNSIFPVLSRLRINECPDLKRIIINGTSLKTLKLGGSLASLEVVDVQTPSLKKCFLLELISVGNALYFSRNTEFPSSLLKEAILMFVSWNNTNIEEEHYFFKPFWISLFLLHFVAFLFQWSHYSTKEPMKTVNKSSP
jgi:hypothetical protein